MMKSILRPGRIIPTSIQTDPRESSIPLTGDPTEIISGAAQLQPPCGEWIPDRHGFAPMGGYDTSNYFNGSKFQNGYLSGAGGGDGLMALAPSAMGVYYAPYNNSITQDVITASGYATGQRGLASDETNAPGRVFDPFEFNARSVAAATTDSGARGFITAIGRQLPMVFTETGPSIQTPEPVAFNQYANVRTGANGDPSVGFLAPHPSCQAPCGPPPGRGRPTPAKSSL
jgi:hypothetical protein